MKRIEETDKNFLAAIPVHEGMRVYDIHSEPFKLYGLRYGEKGFYRMDTEVADNTSDGVSVLNFNTSGGCLRFRTSSRRIILTAELTNFFMMNHMPLTGSASFDIYADGAFFGVFRPSDINDYNKVWSGEITLPEGEKEIDIFFPLYCSVKAASVSLEENAVVSCGRSFSDKLPIVFYGSSITQGGCASHPGNAYPNMLSRGLNREILNLGFSGSCKAERTMCEYISKIPMSLFVYDYDHNADTAEYLESTHERFFREFRESCPDTPVIMLSVADESFGRENVLIRKEIIKRTYENAVNSGDKNVYFLDGQHFYDEIGPENATVDTCHPNDLGFYAFYKNIAEMMKEKNL